MSAPAAAIIVAYAHLIGNYRFQTSNYALFVYDHLLTFSDEVEKIWKQPFTFPNLLFFINRYITHCQFFILQFEFQETKWPISVCDRYVKFAGATTLCMVAVADLVLILRVYALYLGNRYILVFLLFILAGQVIASGWGIHFGIRVPLPHGFPGCVLTGSNSWFTALWGAPLVTDSFIFLFTFIRTIRYRKSHGFTSTVEIILRDGTIYFLVIFSVNLMNTLIYLLAVEDLKAVGASFSQILTSILISRLQLNLRRADKPSSSYEQQTPGIQFGSIQATNRRKQNKSFNTDTSQVTTTFFTIGNLGEEMEGGIFISDKEEKVNGSDAFELFTMPSA